MHLFAYGTLRFPQVWRRIGLGEYASEPATLSGYSILRVKDSVVPGIIRSGVEDHVTGVLFRNIDEQTWFELDTYESSLYRRQSVTVINTEGEQVVCEAYIVPPKARGLLTEEFWDAEWFEQHELARYLQE